MPTLKKALLETIRQDPLFLDVTNDFAVEGYFFWDRQETQSILLDAKLSSEFGLQHSGTVHAKDLTKFYAHFLNFIIKEVEIRYQKESLKQQITKIDLDSFLSNTTIKFAHHRNSDTRKEYFLVAVCCSDYFYKGKQLNKYSNTFDLATWQLNVLTQELIVNENWANMLGYSYDDLQPISFQTFVDLAHPEDVKSTMENVDRYAKGVTDHYSTEIRLRHKNGYWRWVLGKGKAVSKTANGEVEWMMGINYDITDRKIHEKEADVLSLVPVHSFNAVIITDCEGRITFVNSSFEEMTEYKSADVLGRKPGHFLQGANTAEADITSFKEKIRKGKSFNQQILNYTKSGKEFIVSCYVDPIYNEDAEIVKYISIQTDITQHIKDLEYLHTFKATLDQTDDCIFIFDADTLEFTYVNSGSVRMMGYTEFELIGLHPYDIKPEFTKEEFNELINPLKSGKTKYKRFKTIHRTKAGVDLPVEIFLQYIKDQNVKPQFIAIAQDITERIAEKKKLKRLSLVAENTTNLVVITDNEGYVEYVNKAFEEKSGYSLEEMKGCRPSELLHGDKTNSRDIEAYTEGLRSKKPFTLEILHYSKTGDPYWVSITFNPIFNAKNQLQNYIAIETDITQKKAQEERLQESEERLQFVLKGSELGYWDWKVESGKVTVNDRWYEMLGYKSEDFASTLQNWYSLIHDNDLEYLNSVMKETFSNPQKDDFTVEVRVKHKQGHYVWILDRGSVIERDHSGLPIRISGMHMEISDRKNLEATLEKERDFLSQIINVNILSVVIISKAGEIIFANDGAESVLGLKRSTMEGMRYDDPRWQISTLDDKAFPKKMLPFLAVMREKKPVIDIQHGIRYKDGSKKYLSITGCPFTIINDEIEDVIFSVSDITDKIKAQQQLDQTKNQMQSILKNMADILWSVNWRDSKVIYITPSIKKMCGYPQSDFIGEVAPDILHNILHSQDKYITEEIRRQLNEKRSFEVEYRICTSDNQLKWVQNKGTIIYENKKAVRLDGFMVDISERKKHDFEMQRYLEIVEDQNERLKNFTYIVSHNLRSHSANIQGLMYLINKKHATIAENEYVQLLNKASNKLEDTLHHLNDVVSIVSSAEQMEKINLREAFSSFLNAFANLSASSHVKITHEISTNIVVEAVPAFLESIISNLITNAIKYSDPKKNRSYVKITCRKFNGIVIINIKDNGLGIDLKKYGEKLFGMYKTFHNKKDSRGLGLFLTKNQIESMGGKIEVESELGVGSTFKVFLKDGHV